MIPLQVYYNNPQNPIETTKASTVLLCSCVFGSGGLKAGFQNPAFQFTL